LWHRAKFTSAKMTWKKIKQPQAVELSL
jgi:hypothetical protein